MAVTPVGQNLKKNSSYNYKRCRTEFERWLEGEEKSALTIKNYLCDLDAFVRWFEKKQDQEFSPTGVTSIDLGEYKHHLAALEYKPQSINRKLSTLKTFFNWAEGAGVILSLPRVPKPIRETRPGLKWLDRREQHALLRRVEQGGNSRDLAIVKLLLNTGLRVSELCALTWSDISTTPKTGTLTVCSRNGGKKREIPLNKDARSALLSLCYDSNPNPNAPILTGQRGPLSPRGVETMLTKYKGDLSNLSPHSLRHTFCKNLIDAGVGLEQVAAIAGHESLDTTRLYCEPSHHDLIHAVELIGEEVETYQAAD